MSDKKVDTAVARADVDRWLDYKKIGDHQRNERSDEIELLTAEIAEGNIVLHDDYKLELTLKFPLGETGNTNVLTFKPRLQNRDLASALRGIKADDAEGRMAAYAAAITNETRGIISSLDSVDLRVVKSIVYFFI